MTKTMTGQELKLLEEYGEELFTYIIKAFSDYELDFKWKSGWGRGETPGWIDGRGIMKFYIQGYNEEVFAEMDESDLEAFSRFLKDVIKNFIDTYSRRQPFDKLKLEIVDDLVEVYFDDTWDWVKGGAEDIPIIAIEVWLKKVEE